MSEAPTPEPTRRISTPEDAAAAPPSARFGKFIRTQKIGAGGMAEVWKAWDTALYRWVALKFPRLASDEDLARFHREARMAGKLSHPNIAAIYETGEDQGRHFLAMQLIDGRTLHKPA